VKIKIKNKIKNKNININKHHRNRILTIALYFIYLKTPYAIISYLYKSLISKQNNLKKANTILNQSI